MIDDLRDRHPLDAIAHVDCAHTRHYAMCAQCAADAIRPELERLRAELAGTRAAFDRAWEVHAEICSEAEVERLQHAHDGAGQYIGDVLRRLEQAEAGRDALKAATAEVRRLCNLTIAASCRVQAIEQAHDTLAALDRALDAPQRPKDIREENDHG